MIMEKYVSKTYSFRRGSSTVQQIKEMFSKRTMPCFHFGIKSNTSPREICLLTIRDSDKNNRNNRASEYHHRTHRAWHGSIRTESRAERLATACAWRSTKIMQVTALRAKMHAAKYHASPVTRETCVNNAGANYECEIVIKKRSAAASGPPTFPRRNFDKYHINYQNTFNSTI